MTTNAERFENKLRETFSGENVYDEKVNPFAAYLTAKRSEFVQKGIDAWEDREENSGKTMADRKAKEEELGKQFDRDNLQKHASELSKNAALIYSGQMDKEAITAHTQEMVGGLGSSAVAGLMAGDVLGGIGHHARVSLLGFITKIPVFGQLMSFMGSWLGKLLGEGQGLSWSEAGDKMKKEKAMERLSGAYGSMANMQVMENMVEQVSRDAQTNAPLTAAAPAGDTPARPSAEELAREHSGTYGNPVVEGTGAEQATPDDHITSPPVSTQTVAAPVEQETSVTR